MFLLKPLDKAFWGTDGSRIRNFAGRAGNFRGKRCLQLVIGIIWVFPKIMVPPNHPFLIGYSIINHPFWGTPIFGNTHMVASSGIIILPVPSLVTWCRHPYGSCNVASKPGKNRDWPSKANRTGGWSDGEFQDVRPAKDRWCDVIKQKARNSAQKWLILWKNR